MRVIGPGAAVGIPKPSCDVGVRLPAGSREGRFVGLVELFRRAKPADVLMTAVMGPNDRDAVRLVGAVLPDLHEDWAIARRYMSDTSFDELARQHDAIHQPRSRVNREHHTWNSVVI